MIIKDKPIRNDAFDLIRAVAIVFVICIHSMGYIGDVVKHCDDLSYLSVVKGVYDCVIYTGVPLFVMLSGALLLGKTEDWSTFFHKRFKRVLIPFAFWSVTVFLIQSHAEGGGLRFPSSLADFFRQFFTNGVHGIYWFVYMLIGLYLLVPLLRILLSRSDERTAVYMMILLLFASFMSDTDIKIFSELNLPIGIYLFYFIAGYVVYRYFLQKHWFKRFSLMGLVVSFSISYANCLLKFTNKPLVAFVAVFLFSSILLGGVKINYI